MAEISYFQRYSRRENHVTNNTLLILKYFYQQSPRFLETVLSSLLDDDALPLDVGRLEIGPRFRRQTKMDGGIPDARISQQPLNVYVETKLSGDYGQAQIERHVEAIAKEADKHHKATNILIGVGAQPLSKEIGSELTKKLVR